MQFQDLDTVHSEHSFERESDAAVVVDVWREVSEAQRSHV